MIKFKNLKIRTRLIICFVIIAIFTASVGALGMINMKYTYDSSSKMFHEDFIPVQDLKSIQIMLEQVRAQHVYALYDPEPSKLQSRLDQIDQLITNTNELMDSYEKALVDIGGERTLFDKAKESLLEYGRLRTENLDMIKNGKVEDAIASIKPVTAAREKSATDLQALVDYNMQLSLDELNNNQINYNNASLLMLMIIIAAVIIAITLGLLVAGGISKPVSKMVEAANKLALGDINVNVNETSKDEIGSLASAFRKMIENIRQQAQETERIADGDLTVDVKVRSENDLLGKKLYEMVENNNEILSSIKVASEQVAVGAKQVSDSSMALSQGATEQASSVQELTASLEQIASQTELNAQNAGEANELAITAKANAVQGNGQMKEMLKAMVDINESSSKISKVIKVIDDIAFQTNILALNAAVEAARAGQHGKGFAVVAEEVRNLAARSANAAKETTDMIESSIKKAEGGTIIARDTAIALDKIVSGIEKVAELVGNIAVASNEQALGITQINQGIMQVSQVVQTNSATSEESAAASEELSSQASLLKQTVNKYKLKKATNTYSDYDEISPDVLVMLENMAFKKPSINRIEPADTERTTKSTKPSIVLSDREFGKY